VSHLTQATADFRSSGLWSVYLGPRSPLRRIYRRRTDPKEQDLERRLGALLVCAATNLATVLTQERVSYESISAHAQAEGGTDCDPTPAVRCELCVEAQSPFRELQAKTQILADPLMAHLVAKFARVDLVLSARSPLPPPPG